MKFNNKDVLYNVIFSILQYTQWLYYTLSTITPQTYLYNITSLNDAIIYIEFKYIDLKIIIMCPVSRGESKFFKGENNVIYIMRVSFTIYAYKDIVLLFGEFMLLYT